MDMFLKVALGCFITAMAITSFIFLVIVIMAVLQDRKEKLEGATKDIHCPCLECEFWDENEEVCVHLAIWRETQKWPKCLNMPAEDNREE